jgi:DNA-binding LacI/PurR family transcriptional regulator
LICIGFPDQIEALADRETGFLRACQQQGLSLAEQTICHIAASEIDPQWVGGLLAKGVTGALVEYDDQAQALLRSLNTLGVSVPQEFSIALLGDPHYQWIHSPDWTMFTIPRREMGIEAVRLLVERLEHPEMSAPRTVLLSCQIVPGQTIAAPPSPQIKRKEAPVPQQFPST